MIYSYTQISHYLSCPRRYRYRYLDGWKEKDTRAAMLFGRAFEQALSAYFRRGDPGAVLFREWAAHKDSNLEYSNGTTWDRMLQQGVQLLERFAQNDRIRVRQPRKNLQIKITRPLPKGNEFVAYIDAIGHLDGTRCLPEWKTTSSRYPEEPQGLLMLDPQLVCYSWMTGISDVAQVVFVRKATGRDPVLPNHHHRRAARGIRPIGRRHHPSDRIGSVPAAQWRPVSAKPLH
jgi:PD-(D/E)XK nuclease superfamily